MTIGDQPARAFLEDDQEPPAPSEAADGEDFAAVLVPALCDTVLMSQRVRYLAAVSTVLHIDILQAG